MRRVAERSHWGRFVAVVLLLMLSAIAVPSPAVQAQEESAQEQGGLAMRVSVANAVPVILDWSLVHEEFLGLYWFSVTARDDNGLRDLETLVLVMRDADGVETRHEEAGPAKCDNTTGRWVGVVRAQESPIAVPVQVRIEVHDRAGGVAVAQGQGRPLIPWPWHAVTDMPEP